MKTARKRTKKTDETPIEKHLRLCLQYKQEGPIYAESAKAHMRRFVKLFEEAMKS